MSEERRVRDPIHGFIRLSGDEADLIETPVFQRLRGIRQLAMANMVYPGALHTRFDHTLGVFHVTSLLCDVFKFSDEDKRLVRLSALVHDLGHGPFSHVSEGALEIFADREKLKDRLKGDNAAKIHELLTQDLLNSDEDLKHLIGGSTISKIISLLSHGYGEPILRSVVSGPLDADKQDYLLRDSYFCGVKYGIFDLQQLHRELQSQEDPTDGKHQLVISEDGVHALEQFVLAKYYLTAQETVRDITKPKNWGIRRKLEQELAEVIQKAGFPLKCCCKDASNFVIVYSYTQKSVRAQSRNDEGPILVRKGSKVTTFEEASTLFQSIDEKMVRPDFALYAPVEHGNPSERRIMENKLIEPILKCLEGFGNGK